MSSPKLGLLSAAINTRSSELPAERHSALLGDASTHVIAFDKMLFSLVHPGRLPDRRDQKTQAFVASLLKRELLEAWRFRWSNHPNPPNSGFHLANKIPPTLSLTKRFMDSDRKSFSRLIQFRTGHAHIGEYYRRFVKSEDPTCGCGYAIQTRHHILRDCPRYINQRPLLGSGRNANLERLIGTEAGIKRLTKFITHTKAIDKHKPPNTPTRNPSNRTNDRNRRGEG